MQMMCLDCPAPHECAKGCNRKHTTMDLHEKAEKLNRVTEWDGDDALCEWCSQNEATLAIDGEPVCLPCRLDEVEEELHTIKTAGIIEVAVRNPSVSDYMKHWEGRTEKAEARLAEVERERDRWERKHEALRQELGRALEGLQKTHRERDEARALVEELEVAIDSQHAEVGHNIWRFWRDKARETAEKNTLLRARVAAAYGEAAEAANLVPNQAHPADYVDAIRAQEK